MDSPRQRPLIQSLIAFLIVGMLVVGAVTVHAAAGQPNLPEQDSPTSLPDWYRQTQQAPVGQNTDGILLPPLRDGLVTTQALEYVQEAAIADEPTAASIDVWYGANQKFGNLGNPQEWVIALGDYSGRAPLVNLLGKVSGQDPLNLTYSLNGADPVALVAGADGYRLTNDGDFNLEIDPQDLNVGNNTVELSLEDGASDTDSVTVTLNVTKNNTWPLPYTATWSSAGGNIQNVAQVVDGKWEIDGNSVRVVDGEWGYDRLLAMGDITWQDYEVTVPVTVRALDPDGYAGVNNGPNVGVGLRWRGHSVAASDEDGRPRTDWRNLGALAIYRWYNQGGSSLEAAQIYGYGGAFLGQSADKQLLLDQTYVFKLSVQSANSGPSYYRFKFWPQAEPEPLDWDVEAFGAAGEPSMGAVVLQAHYADVSFGEVLIRSLDDVRPTLTIEPSANGSAVIIPDPDDESNVDEFAYGQSVLVYPDPAAGYRLERWGGDAGDRSDNPLQLFMTRDVTLSPEFAEAPNPTITVNDSANGSVAVQPDKANYSYGEAVRFAATPDAGFQLLSWGGNQRGNANPLDLTLEGDVVLEPVFGPLRAPFSDDFNSCSLDDELWAFENPAGDGTVQLRDNERVEIFVPGGSSHDLWDGNQNAPRLLQTAADEDLDIAVKLESVVGEQFQSQGIVVQGADGDYLRTDFFSARPNPSQPAQIFVFAGIIPSTGAASAQLNIPVSPPAASAWYLRLTRVDDTWTVWYSFDGSDWTRAGEFDYTMTVEKAGFFAGNAGGNPEHTAVFDYFFNTGAPIADEDSGSTALPVNIVGDGNVTKSPDKETYACGEAITLTAIPDDGSAFVEWSGSASGNTNPITINYDLGDSVTATFEESSLYTLLVAVIPNEGGTVLKSPDQSTYPEGTQVTLTATPADGYEFAGWSGAASGTEATVEITIGGPQNVINVTAAFEQQSADVYLPVIRRQ